MNRPMTASSRDILIVDDDVYVVKALERVLRPYCSHVFTAISGEQVLMCFARTLFKCTSNSWAT